MGPPREERGIRGSPPRANTAQASIRTGSVSIEPMSRRTAEPSSPSTMRWSKDSDKVHTWRTTSCPSTTQGVSLT